eukprot:1478213-Prymnesium_polylepis.1
MQVGRRAAPSGTRARRDGRRAEGGRRLRAAADASQQSASSSAAISARTLSVRAWSKRGARSRTACVRCGGCTLPPNAV